MAEMNVNFEKAKRQIEAESGPLTPEQEIECKALFYFGQGVKLKNELEQESKNQHRQRVVSAIRDYISGK